VASSLIEVVVGETIDCEGACCCRCECCKGVGFWSAYSLTIPAANSYVEVEFNGGGSHSFWLGLNYSRTLSLTHSPLFGSAGGNGICTPEISVLNIDGTVVSIYAIITINADCSATLMFSVTTSYEGTSISTETEYVYWVCESFNCRTGGSFVYDHYTTTSSGPVSPLIVPDADYSGTTITVSPDGTATWFQCGQNSDGTPYEAPPPPPAPASFNTTAKITAKPQRQPLPLAHPDRCSFLGKRTELRGGCNGWLCLHECDKGRVAIPGFICQSCPAYVADPDFERKGPAGWLT